jgi:hypothetical protein
LQQPGPWGRDALVQNRMPSLVAAVLRKRTAELGLRLVLVRRPGRATGTPGIHCFFAHTGPSDPMLEQVRFERLEDVLDVDLEPLARGRPTGAGSLALRALHVVCTNGARDPCCAERGRPLARSLLRHLDEPDSVWEVSHIGGDRFAGNLVCFPHGLYFGRVEPEDGPRVARAYESGRIDLDHYRGRSCYDFAVQAGEHALRIRHGITGVDDLVLTEHVRRADGALGLAFDRLDRPGQRLRVAIRVRRADEARPLTCHATRTNRPPLYEVLGAD